MLGADLFVRSQRDLAPTDLSLSLRLHAETMAASAAALLRATSGATARWRARFGSAPAEVVGVEHLPPVLTAMRRDHPALTIELAHRLGRRSAAPGRRYRRSHTEPTQGALVARLSPPNELGFHPHRDYLDRRGASANVAGLAAHDLIGFDAGTPNLRAMLAVLPGLHRDAFALRTDSNLTQLAALRAGFGIGVSRCRSHGGTQR